MTSTGQDFILYQGQTKRITVPCVDGDGAPIDLTGSTVAWRVFHNSDEAETDALVEKSTALASDDLLTLIQVNGTGGDLDAAQFTLVTGDTNTLGLAEYWHELYEIDAISNETPLANGLITLKPSPAGRA